MHLRRPAAVLLAFVAVLGGLPAAAQAAPATAQPTSRVHVRPVDGQGHLRPGYRIAQQHGGASCLLGGIAVGRAYRCFAGNFIYDPCWLQADRDHVVCLATPWRRTVVRLHVTRGFDGSFGAAPARPWAFRLTDGTRCVGVQGATGSVGGRPISFTCLDGKTVLLGSPDMSTGQWRIRAARDSSGGFDYKNVGFHAIDTSYDGRRSLRP